MYYKLSEAYKRIYEHVTDLTLTNYEPVGDFIEIDSMWSMIEDLIAEVEHKNDEIDELKQDIQDNYRPIPVAEQYEVSERDFI